MMMMIYVTINKIQIVYRFFFRSEILMRISQVNCSKILYILFVRMKLKSVVKRSIKNEFTTSNHI